MLLKIKNFNAGTLGSGDCEWTMIDIFTRPSEKEVPVDDEDILTTEGVNMSKFDLRQFIMEVLADPEVGQRFKSTRQMPITMTSGRDVKIIDVYGTGDNMEIDFEITNADGQVYTIRSKWSDILGSGGKSGEWFEPVQEQKRVTGAYGGKTYGASPGSLSALKKSDSSAKKAVKAGKFSWADDPYAAAQAAHIVATGEPTVKKGTKRKKTAEGDVHEERQCEQCGTMYEGSTCNECGY
jgi:hypothetical protein